MAGPRKTIAWLVFLPAAWWLPVDPVAAATPLESVTGDYLLRVRERGDGPPRIPVNSPSQTPDGYLWRYRPVRWGAVPVFSAGRDTVDGRVLRCPAA